MTAIEPFSLLLSQIDPRAADHAPLHQVLPNNGPTVGDFRALMAALAARSAPEAGKAVDARQIIFDALDLSPELRKECTTDVVSALSIAGIIPAALASVPAPSGAEPTSDIAGLVDGLAELSGKFALANDEGYMFLVHEAAAALTSLSARLVEKTAENQRNADGFAYHAARAEKERERATASEAEATSLRKTLEEAERQRDDWKATHGRVIQGFAEVCEAVGIQFDAPDAVAYAINAKIGNAEHGLRAAEQKMEEHRRALAEAREHINRYADTAAEHDLVARIDALAASLPEDTHHG